jgi:hypothetical protein
MLCQDMLAHKISIHEQLAAVWHGAAESAVQDLVRQQCAKREDALGFLNLLHRLGHELGHSRLDSLSAYASLYGVTRREALRPEFVN